MGTMVEAASAPSWLALRLWAVRQSQIRAYARNQRSSARKRTMRALVEAAARILEQEGYERANVNRIAEVAGVSVGSLYQYFPTKEALVAAVARELEKEMLAVFQNGLEDDALLPFDDAVRRGRRAHRQGVSRQPAPPARSSSTSCPRTSSRSSEFDAWFSKALAFYFEFPQGQGATTRHAPRGRPLDGGRRVGGQSRRRCGATPSKPSSTSSPTSSAATSPQAAAMRRLADSRRSLKR